ncbi:MAG: translation elongation factor 4 [Candidatus Sumerlaeia bacterium]|nr:translation elongation factor 4 [Candidatus Sumerlaeia bacterium]
MSLTPNELPVAPALSASERPIRNFCIIAHIDHGKSTLADRLLQTTGTLTQREMREQVLDSMDLERERGITIKLANVRMFHEGKDGVVYQLNLIDTPGHVDFTYEVSRALAACEGALLVVDASQGVEAQTLANVYLALENDLEIIPVINKIDLPGADIESTKEQIRDAVGLNPEHALLVSAKSGIGIEDLLQAVIDRVPPPKGDNAAPLRALVFDSFYNDFKGVIVYIRVVDGSLRVGERIKLMQGHETYEVTEIGTMMPKMTPTGELRCGEVGYVVAGIRDLREVRVGDTVTHAKQGSTEALPGYKPVVPVVFAGIYPTNSEEYKTLKESIDKLRLNDSSLHVEPETSDALGFGFRCGFLGLLHMEIIQERLEREYNLDLLFTAPSVTYQVKLTNGDEMHVENPSKMPPAQNIDEIHEPYAEARIYAPKDYMGNVITLCQAKKGVQKDMQFLTATRVLLVYEFPLGEMISDFHDKLKSATAGYASFDYNIIGYRPGDLVKLDVLVNGDPVDALSLIVHRGDASPKGRVLCKKLREIIPRQLFAVAIQAAVGGKIVARETVSALRKDVTAKCYGGDISRKRKLLDKQKEGKKRMKQIGSVEIPQQAFMAVLRLDE